MCALQGKLPNQGDNLVAFATAPRSLRVEWWTDPKTHPTFGCCDDNKFSVGDVFIAEVFVTYAICRNRVDLFGLGEGELFRCDLDLESWRHLVRLLDTS